MRRTCLLVAAIAASVGLAAVRLPAVAAEERWTLATDDTALTIARVENGGAAILELTSPTQPVNWIAKPCPLPLPARVDAGGQSLAPDWKLASAEIDKSIGLKLTLLFASTTPRLELRSEWWARPGEGPVRQAQVITNQTGGPVEIPYQPSLALELTPPQSGGAAAKAGTLSLWYFHTDGGAPDARGVYHEQLTDQFGRTIHTESEGVFIPLAVLDSDGHHGVYVGVEWGVADIRVTGSATPTAPGAAVTAGSVSNFRAQLAPGQRFDLPPAFVGTYEGDIDDAGNSLRRYLFSYSMPEVLRKDAGYPKVQWNAFGATGKTPGGWDPVETKYYPLIDDIAPLGFEEVMIDVGWWGPGAPEPDPTDWPSGMKRAAEYAHQKGLRFGLYWSDNQSMAAEEARKVRTDRVKSLFLKQGADSWRSDCTSGPVFAPDYASAAGFYQMVDQLQRDVPGFQWEDCSGGGRIKDYGSMKRCMKVFNSDAYSPLDVRRAFHDSSFALHPMQLEGHLGSPNGSYRPHGAVEARYAFRCMSMGAPEWFIDAPNGGNGGGAWTSEERDAVRDAVTVYKTKVRPLVRTANLYHILPRPDDHNWDGIEFYDPTTGKGVVYLFKPDSPNDTQTVKLRGLEAGTQFRLTFQDGSNAPASKSAEDLMNTGIEVKLAGKFVSELMFFEKAGR